MKKLLKYFDWSVITLMLFVIVFALDFKEKPFISYSFIGVFVLVVITSILRYYVDKKA
jgi:hypothetical protein